MAKLNQLFKQFKNKAMKVLKLQRMKHILNKKNSLFKFQMLCPNISPPQGEEVEVEHLVEVFHQEEVWIEDV